MAGSKAVAVIVDLSEQQSAFVDEMVRSGDYASADDVVRAAIDALQDSNDDFEAWLKRDVVKAHEGLRQNPASALSSDQVLKRLGLPPLNAGKAAKSS